MNYQEFIDEVSVGELVNVDGNAFWHTSLKWDKRYEHESGKVGDVFYDGNNGDRWTVLAISTEHNRILVENKTQGGKKLAYWN